MERVTNYREAIAQISTGTAAIDGVALKAVHAGPRYRGTFVVDGDVTAALRQFLPAAPAHNAIYLTAIEAFQEAMPGVPIVAAFEPEFHATMPEYARQYGVRESGSRTAWKSTGSTARRISISPGGWRRCWGGR